MFKNCTFINWEFHALRFEGIHPNSSHNHPLHTPFFSHQTLSFLPPISSSPVCTVQLVLEVGPAMARGGPTKGHRKNWRSIFQQQSSANSPQLMVQSYAHLPHPCAAVLSGFLHSGCVHAVDEFRCTTAPVVSGKVWSIDVVHLWLSQSFCLPFCKDT